MIFCPQRYNELFILASGTRPKLKIFYVFGRDVGIKLVQSWRFFCVFGRVRGQSRSRNGAPIWKFDRSATYLKIVISRADSADSAEGTCFSAVSFSRGWLVVLRADSADCAEGTCFSCCFFSPADDYLFLARIAQIARRGLVSPVVSFFPQMIICFSRR